MPIYNYKVSRPDGRVVEGQLKADSDTDAITQLHSKGNMIINVEESVGFDLSKLKDIQIGGIPLKEKVFFVKQFAAMLKAGLPVVQSIEILLDQTKNPGIRNKLTDVYKDVKSGLSLSKSFQKYDLIFSPLQISLVESGEQSGNLVEVMLQISIDMQKSYKLRGKIRGAMIYPAIILFVAFIVMAILIVFMVPSVSDLYEDLGASPDDIPFITKFLVNLSNAFTNPVGIVSTIVVFSACIMGYRVFYKGEFGRRFIDKLKLRVPVFGDLILKNQVLQTVRLLGMLLNSGISIIDALRSTSNAIDNVHFKIALDYSAEQVSKGAPLSVSLAKNNVVPVLVTKMIATGEDTGTLDKILGDLTDFYEDEVDELTSNLTKMMEPFMLLIVGGLVAFLAISVYLPIYSIANII